MISPQLPLLSIAVREPMAVLLSYSKHSPSSSVRLEADHTFESNVERLLGCYQDASRRLAVKAVSLVHNPNATSYATSSSAKCYGHFVGSRRKKSCRRSSSPTGARPATKPPMTAISRLHGLVTLVSWSSSPLRLRDSEVTEYCSIRKHIQTAARFSFS